MLPATQAQVIEYQHVSPRYGAPIRDPPYNGDSIPHDRQRLKAIESLDYAIRVVLDQALLATLIERWGGRPHPKADRTRPARAIKTTAVIGLGGIIRHLGNLNPAFGMPEAGFGGNTSFG